MSELVSVAIMAGGQSRRMGQDKAWLEVGGQPVIERVLTRVKPLADDVFISANAPDKYQQFGLRIVPDIYPYQAALGGIFSAITAARHSHVLIVACDMPFLNIDLLSYLISLASTAEVIAPLIESDQPQPMHAVYSKNCLPAIQSCLLAGRLRLVDFWGDVSVHYVKRDEIARFDPDFYSFVNLNTPEDWRKAQDLAEKLAGTGQ